MNVHARGPRRSRSLGFAAGLFLLGACESDDDGGAALSDSGSPATVLDGGAVPTGLLDAAVGGGSSDGAAPVVTPPVVTPPVVAPPVVTPPGQKPLYLATSWVAGPDSTSTYISLFDSVDTNATLDFAQALEVAGYGDAWVVDGVVYVADGETPTITRYEVSDGKLVKGKSISFANFGLRSAAFYDNEIFSPTKAYAVNGQSREYIAWNPTTMEIIKQVPWPALNFPAGNEPFQSYTDRGGVVVGKYFFHAIYQHEGVDFIKFGDSSVVGVYDIETDTLVKTINVPCPMMDVMTLAGDGKLYLSAWTYLPLSALAGYTPKNCAARIDPATQELDPSWTLDFPSITGGSQGHGIRAVTGNEGIFAAFLGSGIPVTPNIDMWDLDKAENDWELFSFDFATRTAKATGVKFSDGSYYEAHIGDRYFVFLGSMSDSQVYERTAAGYVPKFKARGWMSRLFKVR